MSRIRTCAKKTLLALKNPAGSVQEVFENALDAIEEDNGCQYMGVKNVRQIPMEFVRNLESKGFVLHTLDAHSHNGRAVDYALRNPITGQPMTGSSSGTAINVFLGINDLGIGTDGGGSVLAPALAVNCFGFISPLMAEETMKQYTKQSTDGIAFYPSLGFVTAEYPTMTKAIDAALDLEPAAEGMDAIRLQASPAFAARAAVKPDAIVEVPAAGSDRNTLIEFLDRQLPACDVFADWEEKIDFHGLGDTVFGHFDQETAEIQSRSGKGLIRVANMVKATALTIPATELSSGFTLYCESKPEKIRKLLAVAAKLLPEKDALVQRYFRDPAPYFEKGFVWNH